MYGTYGCRRSDHTDVQIQHKANAQVNMLLCGGRVWAAGKSKNAFPEGREDDECDGAEDPENGAGRLLIELKRAQKSPVISSVTGSRSMS